MFLDERTRTRLAAATRFADIRFFDVVDSTNRIGRDLAAAGGAGPVVLVADFQTAGRGRLDRRWAAAAGSSLLVSVVSDVEGLEPARWHLVTAAVGLAAREACERVAGFRPLLKWPNDLLVGERKLAGILAEVVGSTVVVGMGMNVRAGAVGAAGSASAVWGADAISAEEAAGREVSRSALLEVFLVGLDARLGRWDDVADEYRSGCDTVGRRVRVEVPGGELVGTAVTVAADGRLVVRTDGGASVPVSAGDVTHLRAEG